MIYGPNEIHKCPECGKLYIKRTLVSGNTTGARYYTDGKMVASLMEEFPQITKCKNCFTIFWLDNPINEVHEGDDENEVYKDTLFASFLKPYDYLQSINMVLFRDQNEETYLRMKLWYTFNDRVRDLSSENDEKIFYQELFTEELDVVLYENNCRKLIEIQDKVADNRIVAIAELKRNLTLYDESIAVLDTVTTPQYQFAIKCIRNLCEMKNRYTRLFET